MTTTHRIALGLAAALLAACVSPGQRAAEDRATAARTHAADQDKCAGYGFAPGTDAYANCMMGTAERREAKEDHERRSEVDAKARMRELSLDRSGDERFPICGAASSHSHLDSSGFWYGDDCRAR